MKSFKKRVISDVEREAGIARFNAGKPENHVVQPMIQGAKAVRNVDGEGYQPKAAASYRQMGTSYREVIQIAKPAAAVVSYSSKDRAIAAKEVKGMADSWMTSSERFADQNKGVFDVYGVNSIPSVRKESRFDIAVRSAYVMAMRVINAAAGAPSTFIPSGIFVYHPTTAGTGAIGSFMADNGYGKHRYHKPKNIRGNSPASSGGYVAFIAV